MISLKNIRDNKQKICEGLLAKNFDISIIDVILEKDGIWRSGISQVEKLKEQRNQASKEVAVLKKEKKTGGWKPSRKYRKCYTRWLTRGLRVSYSWRFRKH